jgi:molecular chaperone HscB
MQAGRSSRRECWRCRAAADALLVCPRCQAVQPLVADADLFSVLGLPRSLVVDLADLEARYHAASRAVHPDRHQTASPRERELSLAASAAVNRAYRTLRDPVARGRYWLELHGTPLAENNNRVPTALAAEVFAVQEMLEELRAGASGEVRREVTALRADLAGRIGALVAALAARYADGPADAPPALDDLKRRLSDVAYLRTLLADIDESLGDETSGTHHRH